MTSIQEEEKTAPTADRAVAYEPPARYYATRRQFRWLLILLLLNFGVTIQTAYWPGLSSTIKTEWTQWRERRRARDLQKQAMNWTEPPNKVVWDEDPQTAAALLATEGYKPIRVEELEYLPSLKNWPRGARAVLLSPIDQFYRDRFNPTYHHPFPNRSGERGVKSDEYALILMHNFKTGSGEDRLVYVYVQGKLNLADALAQIQGIPGARWEKPFSSTVAKELSVIALPCSIAGEDKVPVVLGNEGATLLIHPPPERRQQPWSWTPQAGETPEQISFKESGFFRFYAGQIDPADPSHFTIAYDLDNKKGTIHGRIKSNGLLELKPDSGKVVGSNWYPQQ